MQKIVDPTTILEGTGIEARDALAEGPGSVGEGPSQKNAMIGLDADGMNCGIGSGRFDVTVGIACMGQASEVVARGREGATNVNFLDWIPAGSLRGERPVIG